MFETWLGERSRQLAGEKRKQEALLAAQWAMLEQARQQLSSPVPTSSSDSDSDTTAFNAGKICFLKQKGVGSNFCMLCYAMHF